MICLSLTFHYSCFPTSDFRGVLHTAATQWDHSWWCFGKEKKNRKAKKLHEMSIKIKHSFFLYQTLLVFFLNLLPVKRFNTFHRQLSASLHRCCVLSIISFWPRAKIDVAALLALDSRNWFNILRSGPAPTDCCSNFIFSSLSERITVRRGPFVSDL